MRKRSEVRPPRRMQEEPSIDREYTIDIPNDPVNEMVVLAAMAADPETCDRLLTLAPPDAFYAKPHKLIREVFGQARQRGLALDPAMLQRLNPEMDIRIVEKLRATRPDVPDDIDAHVDNLLWDWQRAQVMRGPGSAWLDAMQDPNQPKERVRALARQIGDSFEGKIGRARFIRDSKEVVREAMASLRKRARGEAFFPFGITGLDYDENGKRRCRPGAAPGQVTILTGLSGSGKTTFAAHIILGLVRQKRRVLVGAWEVRAPMTLELLATLSLGWSRSRILDGKSNTICVGEDFEPLSEAELDQIEAEMMTIAQQVTFIENPFQRGSTKKKSGANDEYLDVLEDHVQASGCDACILDLFDRCLRHRSPDEEQEALWRVVEFTDRFQIHMVLVHQQLLKGENVRADKKPSLPGLKGSSAYVDSGALIIAPHIPARFKAIPDTTFEVYGLKQRYGPPFAIEFDWEPDTGQISGGRTFEAKDSLEAPDEAFGAPSKRPVGKGFHSRGRGRRN